MATLRESVVVRAPLAECWDLYFEPRAWPAWVDGFARLESLDGGYPEVGGTLRWRSVPAGRGTVSERVLEHAARHHHRIAFSDPESEGELETTFAIEPGADGATRVSQELTYALRRRGPLARAADVLFIRGQLRASLARSLERLRHELEQAR